MSRDHLAMDIDRSIMELMLRLLNVEGTVCPNTDDSSVELDKMRQRIQNICNQQLLSAGRKDKHIKSLTIEDTTVSKQWTFWSYNNLMISRFILSCFMTMSMM
jgi:hypothetical protein